MEEKVLTLHPKGKKGVNISRAKYETMRATILQVLMERPGLSHLELTSAVEKRLEGQFEGSIPWYMEATKLDLEARKILMREKGERVETYRLR